MKRCFAILCCLFALIAVAAAQDITKLEKIGPVASFTKTQNGVILTCQDRSQVQITVLAPDLVRVRASFAKPFPALDHSWAIAKTDWPAARWIVSEPPGSVVITTDELEVVVRRAPLLIEFRDAKTHASVNADEQPMAFDAHDLLKDLLFDPRAGSFVAVSKKLGFNEHFYGLGEKRNLYVLRSRKFFWFEPHVSDHQYGATWNV